MSAGSDYDGVKLLARALIEREQNRAERAVELLQQISLLCKGKDSGTCQYLTRTAHTILYAIHQASGREKEAARHRRTAVKLGATKEDLEKA